MYREIEADAQHFLAGGPEWFATQASDHIKILRAEYLREADLMKAERDHAAKAPPAVSPPANIVLNISHSQLVGLNVAGAVGSLQASLTTIQTGGEDRIAEALKALAGRLRVMGHSQTRPRPNRLRTCRPWGRNSRDQRTNDELLFSRRSRADLSP